MILVDTSIWIDHLRTGNERLSSLLNQCMVLGHPFVTGELALGNLPDRETVLGALQDLPQADRATDPEVLQLIGDRVLHGLGIGYIDAHLLAAVLISPGATLWTRDKRLLAASEQLGIAAKVMH
jgi:hypothetical protein